MSDSDHKYFERWNGPLLPFSAFYEYYTKGHKWVPHRDEHIIPRSLYSRIRITTEHAEDWNALELGRSETLAEHNIWDAEEDAKEVAKTLMDTLFMDFSEHEMRYIMTEMMKYCNGSEEYRRSTDHGPLYELIDVDFNKYHPKAYEKNSSTEAFQECGGQHEDEGQERL
jgi:hypothetical protein